MITRTKETSTLRAAPARAGLARTGAMLAMALGVAQAGATTYTVPLQFNLTLAAPVCSLTVDGVTANATTPTQSLATSTTVDLTPTPLAVINSPNGILAAMTAATTLTTFTSDAPGLVYAGATYAPSKRVTTPPTASATCTVGTPMIAKVKAASGTAWSQSASGMGAGNYMVGSPAVQGGSDTLPIGMLMGIASFAGSTIANGASGSTGTTYNNGVPSVNQTATGNPQAIVLTPAVYAKSTTLLTASYAGTWIYKFDVSLDF